MSDRPRLEAVLLDAGGTLVRLDFEWMSEELARLGHTVDVERLRRGEVVGRRRYDASRKPAPPGEPAPLGSAGDVREYLGGMLEAAGVAAATIDVAYPRFIARQEATGLWTRPAEGARAALDGLESMGLRCACVSNSDGRVESHLRDTDMLRGLEFVVDSQLVGFEKPDPRIFRVALDRMGLDPDRVLFVGDIRSVDEGGAAAAGTHFVLLDPYGDYAPPGTPAIERIDRLPDWISAHFDLEPRREREPLPR
jgi:putative hydrolase of the HAD superfamily